MKYNLIPTLLLSLCSVSLYAAADTDPLIGTWKTIDERTGYSLADVAISKDKDQNYTAKIIRTRAIPGTALQETCIKCSGTQKNIPIIGMAMLTGLNADPKHRREYIDGKMIDPLSGQQSIARARLMNSGKHLLIHSRPEGSTVGRNITWVKY